LGNSALGRDGGEKIASTERNTQTLQLPKPEIADRGTVR
jgi:hypothetical protein